MKLKIIFHSDFIVRHLPGLGQRASSHQFVTCEHWPPEPVQSPCFHRVAGSEMGCLKHLFPSLLQDYYVNSRSRRPREVGRILPGN